MKHCSNFLVYKSQRVRKQMNVWHFFEDCLKATSLYRKFSWTPNSVEDYRATRILFGVTKTNWCPTFLKQQETSARISKKSSFNPCSWLSLWFLEISFRKNLPSQRKRKQSFWKNERINANVLLLPLLIQNRNVEEDLCKFSWCTTFLTWDVNRQKMMKILSLHEYFWQKVKASSIWIA